MSEENQQLAIQKLYLKDVSFESPNAPNIFSEDSVQPSINVQLNSSNQVIVEGVYEVVLDITVTAKHNDRTAFLVELKQAGVFSLSGFSEEDLVTMLNAYCPETLFPFAREAIAELIGKGGFPQFILQPVNFNALLAQQVEQQVEQQAEQQAEQSGQEKAH